MDGKGKGMATEDMKGKVSGKVKGKGNSEGKGIVRHNPREDNMSHAVALQLQKEMSEPAVDTDG